MTRLRYGMLIMLVVLMSSCYSQATVYGYSGLISIPTASPAGDGRLVIGAGRIPRMYSALKPYSRSVFFGSLVFLPGMEAMLGVVRPDQYAGGIGDRTAALRMTLFKESNRLPGIAIGMQDFFAARGLELESPSAQHFAALYAVASKQLPQTQLGRFALHAGYGSNRMIANERHLVGFFGGLGWQPLRPVNVMLEYDAQSWNAGVRFEMQAVHFMICWWRLRDVMGTLSFTLNLL